MVSDEIEIERAVIQGLRRTQEGTILGLLPRTVPGWFTQAELQEVERPIRNLSLFDRAGVAVGDRLLPVDVLEKFTLAPILNFSTGSSLSDLSATAGLWNTTSAG